MSLQKGLVGHWTFDAGATNNSTAYDSSAYDNHGILNGGIVTDSSGQINESYTFDGTDDYVAYDSVLSSGQTEFTFSCWSYIDDKSTIRNHIMHGDTALAYLRFNGSQYELAINNGTDGWVRANGFDPNLNEWYHIVGVFDNNELRLYVDSVLQDTNTSSTGPDSTSNLSSIGFYDRGTAEPHSGRIDDVRIYDRALNVSEINQLYQMRSPRTQTNDLAQGLVGHWTMDDADTSGGTLYDRSAYNAHGSLQNGVTPGASSIIGESYAYDADEDAVDVPVNNALDISDTITISVWLNLNSDSDANGNTSHHVYKGDYGIIHNNFFVVDSNNNRVGPNGTIPTDNSWNHICMTYDGAEVKAWLNGSVDSSTSYTGSIATGSGTLRIGNAGGYDWTTDGEISNLRIYDRALSQSEISALYNKRT